MNIRTKLSENSPQIFMVAGILGFIGSTITAIAKSDKVKPIIKNTKDELKAATIDDRRFGFKNKTDERLFKTKVVCTAAIDISKELAIPISLATISTGCILKSYKIMNNRQLALVGTIDILKTGADVYKKAVIDEVGEETAKKIDEKVFLKHMTDQIEKARKGDKPSNDVETFSRYFSKETSNKYPEGGADAVLPFLKSQETYFNQLLHSRERFGRPGFVRFNEVLDALGFPKIPEGETAGWISRNGEGFVDFGISGAYYADYDGVLDRYNCVRDPNKIPRSDSGYMLCFNVDPYILKM